MITNNEIPILIYQMGKVGSTSIYKSIKGYKKNVFHVHYLHARNLDNMECLYRDRKMKMPEWINVSKTFLKNYYNLNSPLKIIVPVREPIGRNMSAFFENLKIFSTSQTNDNNADIQNIAREFRESYRHNVPLDWFDNEFYKFTGIDIYTFSFPQALGYQNIKINNFEILLIKVELNDYTKAQIIGEFLKIQTFALTNYNISSTKEYNQIFSRFKAAVSIDDQYVNKMYDSKYSKHFYTREELQSFRNKFLLKQD